jgi:23S rRNA (uracil1939-C5)-methyltransferase
MNEASEGRVVRLAARGDGVTADGRFVPGAAPGDLVSADGSLLPGPNRAVAPCPHFGDCGGCQLQHVTDEAYAGFVRDRCLEPLARLGIVPREVAPVALSPPGTRRRASLRAVREGGNVRLGFNAEGTHRLVDLSACPVLSPALFRLLAPLRALLAQLMPARGGVGVTLTETEGGPDLLLSNLGAERLPVVEALSAFAAAHGLARLSVEGPLGVETVVAPGVPSVTMGGVAVVLPPGVFLQPTREGEAALVAAVREATSWAARIADLFSGVGTFALPLSERASVLAVDAAGPAVGALAAAAKAAGRRIGTAHRDLFRRPLAADEMARFDAVVFDPPRSGAIAQVAELAASRVPVVTAISCNPATFARDAERLAGGGYRLQRLWPVAQFRWSTHVEVAALFRRDG